jgi:diguanylate cyclase (GGDEF)-like protein
MSFSPANALVETDAPAVLLLADQTALAAKCRTALEPLGARVSSGWSETDGDAPPDCVIVTSGLAPASRHGWPAEATIDTRPGVIVIGDDDAEADVRLPVDFLPRELATVCHLLTTAVRLRRQLARGQRIGAHLEQAAFLDPLTQLANRRAWDEELSRWLGQSGPRPFCLAIADIDHFKQINDGWGHAAGDQLLVATGLALRQSLRQGDFVARLGGDEFGLLLIGLDDSAAGHVLKRVQSGLPGRIAAASRQVASISIGFACASAGANIDPLALMLAADEALRQAKRHGRNQVIAGDASAST